MWGAASSPYLKIVSYYPRLCFWAKDIEGWERSKEPPLWGAAHPVPSCEASFCQLWRPLGAAPNSFLPRAGVQRSPTELPAGQVDLTGATSPYSLFNMTYKEEDFDRLLQLSDYNVQNSQDAILQALRMVLEHRAPGAGLPEAQS